MKKVVIASDSFKGSLSSMEVAKSVEVGIQKVFPQCDISTIPVADGGEGTLEAILFSAGGRLVSCIAHSPLGEKLTANYGVLEDNSTVIIELAGISGLSLVPVEKRNPLLTSTFGLGEVIKDALLKGYRKFMIGIGGSATNDGGTGMLQALGVRFLNNNKEIVEQGGQILEKIEDIDLSGMLPELKEAGFTIASDVNNPFWGAEGATNIYAKQKGADEAMIVRLDKGMRRFAELIQKKTGTDLNLVSGSGAAGGIGGAFYAFLSATLKPGIKMILELMNFHEIIKGADLIITGEGKLDKQTVRGKVPQGVLEAAKPLNIPVVAIGGQVEETELLNKLGFLSVLSISPFPVELEKAMEGSFTSYHITRTIEQYFRSIRYFSKYH